MPDIFVSSSKKCIFLSKNAKINVSKLRFFKVRCMKLVQHPNIVRLYEVIDTQTKLFLILELGDYDMYDFIMRNADKVNLSLSLFFS